MHANLPFLFSVCLGTNPSIVTSFHGFGHLTITIHSALYTKSVEVVDVVASLSWINILQQICSGLEHLRCKLSIIHNDLKCDNVLLTSTQACTKPVIIDFGKACQISYGKKYNLSHRQREMYELNHPQIAPDLRDGLCKQSDASDMFSFGKIVNIINSVSYKDHNEVLKQVSQKCMQYRSHMRPSVKCISAIFV